MLARPEDALMEALPPQVAYLFAPLDKRALGVAVGTVAGLALAMTTVAHLLIRPRPELELSLLSHYFPGYTVSPLGILVGFFWTFIIGFCAGWFVAFVRNLVIASWLFVTRSRAEIETARDFLDHV
jgi:hypothetical protein